MIGMRELLDPHPGQLLGLAPEHCRQRAIDAHEASVEARDRHADAGVLERATEALLGLAKGGGLLIGADRQPELAIDADAAQAPPPAGGRRSEAQRQLD